MPGVALLRRRGFFQPKKKPALGTRAKTKLNMSKKQSSGAKVKHPVARERRIISLQSAIRTAHLLEEQIRWNYSESCKHDALLALVLLGRLETAVKLKNKLTEIVACLEVES